MKHLILILFVLSTVFSCQNEKIINPEFLAGKWIIVEASRNGKITNTLDGAFFFFEQNVLTTNFMGIENQAEFKIQNNELELTKGLNYTFHLQKMESQFLLMTTKIQNTNFVFKLKKE